MELEEGDGLDFAKEMRKLPIRQPFVVVTTNTSSSSIFQYLRHEIRVDFIYQKSNSSYSAEQVLGIIEKVYKYHSNSRSCDADEKEQLRKRIYHELDNIGFPSSYAGTDYLAFSLLYISRHIDEPLLISKIIYPAVAKEFHTDASNVEKAIRTAIEHVWKNANLMTLSKFYPYEVENKNGRPSNGEFIRKMKLKLFGR